MSPIHAHDPSTRSGRPLKHDVWYYKAAQEYLIAWKEIMHKIVDQHQVLGLPLNPEPPAEVYYYGHGLRRHHYAFQTQVKARALQTQQGGSGGGRGGTTFADPGHPSISWFNGLILDTGNPDAQYFPNAPGNFNRMDQVYSGYNVLISDGVVVVVAASNNLASGQPISATNPESQWQGGGGGDESAVSTNPFSSGGGGFYSWNWYSLHDILPTLYFAQTVAAGFETWDWSSSEPGVGGTGNCPQNERLVNASINTGNGWQNFKATIDTGTPVAMIGGLVGGGDSSSGGGGSGTVQMRFDPNPNPIDVPYDSRNKGLNFIPAYHMSKRIKMALTKDYTIVTSLADPSQSITYACSGGTQQGDSLQGKEWPV